MKTKISNVKAVLEDRVLENATVIIENGIIRYVGGEDKEADELIDGDEGYLLPGFIDIHCHGGNGIDLMDATPEELRAMAEFHLMHGTTTLFPTTLTDTWEAIEAALDTYASIPEGDRLNMCGVHLEGPWLSPAQCGAQDTSRMDKPSVEKILAIKEKYPFVKRITIAPEIEGGMEVARAAKELGMVVSAGHTDADFDTVIRAKDYGYTLLTHLYSGMAGVIRRNSYRIAGAVEAGLYDDDLFVEIIADGKHLPSSLLRLIYKCCGADRICLITDAIRPAGAEDGTVSVSGRRRDGLKVIVEDGVAKVPDRQCFAGSIATADRLVRTMRDLCDIDIVNISKMASTTPARVMGLTDRGAIKEGLRADLVLMNEELYPKLVFLSGEMQSEE